MPEHACDHEEKRIQEIHVRITLFPFDPYRFLFLKVPQPRSQPINDYFTYIIHKLIQI